MKVDVLSTWHLGCGRRSVKWEVLLHRGNRALSPDSVLEPSLLTSTPGMKSREGFAHLPGWQRKEWGGLVFVLREMGKFAYNWSLATVWTSKKEREDPNMGWHKMGCWLHFIVCYFTCKILCMFHMKTLETFPIILLITTHIVFCLTCLWKWWLFPSWEQIHHFFFILRGIKYPYS